MPSRFDGGKAPHHQTRGLDKFSSKRGGMSNPKQYIGARPSLLRPRSVNSSFESSGMPRMSPANASIEHSGYLTDRTDHRKQFGVPPNLGRGRNVMGGNSHVGRRGGEPVGKENIYQVRR